MQGPRDKILDELGGLFHLLSDHFPQFSKDNVDLVATVQRVHAMRWNIPAVTVEYWNKVLPRVFPHVKAVVFFRDSVILEFDPEIIYSLNFKKVDWKVIVEHWWGG